MTYKRCLYIQEEMMSLHTRRDDAFTYRRRRCLYIQDEMMSLHTGADDVFTSRR